MFACTEKKRPQSDVKQMRLTIQLLPLLLLILLPLLQWAGYITSLLSILASLILILCVRTACVFLKLGNRQTDKRIILETISISHYVEKVRWAMDYINIPYEEEENSGILGILTLGRSVPQLKVPQADLVITNSADILRYLYGCHAGNPAREEFLRRTDEAAKWEQKFDLLGEHYRRFCYFTIFSAGNVAEYNQCVWGQYQPGVPGWQKQLLSILSPLFQLFVSTRLRVTEEEKDKSLEEARQICQEVDELLSDGREFLLSTVKPTYLDFHLASMLAIVITTPQYSGGVLTSRSVNYGASKEVIEEGERLKKTRTGKFVVKCFEEYRYVKLQ